MGISVLYFFACETHKDTHFLNKLQHTHQSYYAKCKKQTKHNGLTLTFIYIIFKLHENTINHRYLFFVFRYIDSLRVRKPVQIERKKTQTQMNNYVY